MRCDVLPRFHSGYLVGRKKRLDVMAVGSWFTEDEGSKRSETSILVRVQSIVKLLFLFFCFWDDSDPCLSRWFARMNLVSRLTNVV